MTSVPATAVGAIGAAVLMPAVVWYGKQTDSPEGQ